MNRTLLLTALTGLAIPMMAQTGVDQILTPTMRPFGTPMLTAGEIRPSILGVRRVAADKPVFTPDWTGSITDQEQFDWFTVIDANGDESDGNGVWKWRSDAGCAYYAYSYSAYGEQVDDWLVSPGLRLKAGKQYTLHFYTTNRSNFYEDKMEVKLGTDTTVEALSTELMPQFSLKSMSWEERTVEFTVDTDGVYYIGFHLMEAGYMSTVFLDEVSVTGEKLAASPAAVENLTITPDPSGDPKALISFTLPTKTVDGQTLSSLQGVRIRNGYFDIADLKNVTPGQQVVYTADMAQPDTYVFNIVAYNDVDEGVNSTETLYVGLDIPDTPQNVVMHDMVDHIKIDCDPITSAHGGVFFPEDVDFNVYEITRDEYGFPAVGDLVASVKGNTTLDINMSTVIGDQYTLNYVTNASNIAGPSPNYYQTNTVVFGAPYALPFEDSFDNGLSSNFWLTQKKNNGWGNTGIYSSVVDSYDPTPGCMILSAINVNDMAGFFSGKIAVQGASSPVFAFAAKKATSREGTFRVLAYTPEWEEIEIDSRDVSSLPDEWTAFSYDLSPYTSHRYLMIGLQYTNTEARDNSNQIWFDDMFVGTLPAADLRTAINAPRVAERGSTVPVAVRVDNRGASTVNSFNLTLTANGEQVAQRNVECELPILGMTVVNIDVPVRSIETADQITYVASVEMEGDANPADNTASASVNIENPDLAAPSDLVAEEQNNGISLRWTPVGNLAPRTDNIDSYEPWNYLDELWGWVEHNVGSWTMVDVDRGSTGGFTDALQYGSQGQKFAFTVFNPYDYTGYGKSLFTVISEESGESFIPRSGEQYFAGVYSADTHYEDGVLVGVIKDADNWVISPEQTGDAQTISFWVNNYKGLAGNGNIIDHVETYEVLYSTTGMEIEDFTRVGESCTAAGGTWQKVSFDLPEGTKYFAIRHCSPYNAENGTPFILMVDDITYNVPNKPLASYRIYRDGQLIATVSPETSTFIDPSADGTAHLYQVTALYEDGTESAAVSTDSISSGVVNISTDKATFDVFTSTGVLVRSGVTDLNDLPAGIYITSDGRKIRR